MYHVSDCTWENEEEPCRILNAVFSQNNQSFTHSSFVVCAEILVFSMDNQSFIPKGISLGIPWGIPLGDPTGGSPGGPWGVYLWRYPHGIFGGPRV